MFEALTVGSLTCGSLAFGSQTFGSLDWIEYLNNGISINLPNLKSHEFVSFYFSLSWKKTSDDKDVSTWFAANCFP